MEMHEIKGFLWRGDSQETNQSIINADRYNPNCKKALKFLYINKTQNDIKSYYFTTRGGHICWVKLDPTLIVEKHRRAAKAATNDFRTATYISRLAGDRKTAIDRLLMDFKSSNPDFRYLVRNGENDLKVSIKRLS